MLPNAVATQQVLRGIATSLTAPLPGADGEPVTGLTATVTVVTEDGTALYTDAAATGNTDGTYSRAVTATDLANLNVLTATWKVAGNVRAVTTHEVVASYYFTASEIAQTEQGRAAPLDRAAFGQLRAEVEAECEAICAVAFVPRYRRAVLDGGGRTTLLLPDPMPRTVRTVRVYTSADSFTAFTADEVAALDVQPHGIVTRRDGGQFPAGSRNVVLEYEHGFDRPPPDLRRATMRRARTRSNSPVSGIPDRATSFTAENGATYRLHMPGESRTGDPDVDAIYDRYAWKSARISVA